MAKDPAFLFYPSDWIGGTMGMTFEEKGAYMELLMMQFNRGHMTTHMIGQVVGQHWDKLKDKFIKDAEGLYYNARLEDEKNKRKSFTESRRNNVLGENQHTKKSKKIIKKPAHMTSHMEDGDINEGKGLTINKDELIYPFDSLNFKRSWDILIAEKEWRKKSKSALQASLKKLSKYDEQTAMEMIDDCIAGGWKGLVEPKKNYNNSNNGNKGETKTDGVKRLGELANAIVQDTTNTYGI